MKALVISVLVLVMSFFFLNPVFGQPKDANQIQPEEKKEEPVKELDSKKHKDADSVTDTNTVGSSNEATVANVANDPNAVKAEIKKFHGLSGALKKVDGESRDEIREWTRGRLDDRLELALAMQKQVKEELKFLRGLAVKEKAAETVAAIDGILLDRQERFKGVIEELEKNSERIRRLMEREERRNQERSNHRERMQRERMQRERSSRSTQP